MSGGVCPRTDVRHNIIIIMYNSNSNVFKNGIDQNISDFYRAMLCIRSTGHGPVSVRPSVCPLQVGVLLACELPSPVLHCVKRKFGYLQK